MLPDIFDLPMSLGDHLHELRRRLIVPIVAFVLLFMLGFAIDNQLKSFLIQPLLRAVDLVGIETATKVGLDPARGERMLTVFGVGESVMLSMNVAFVFAIALTIPIFLYQVWAFVAPGLYSHEKKLVLPLVVSSTLLFFIGVAFCYFFVFGQVFKFIQGFTPKSITAAPDIEAYLSFVMSMFIAFGAAFEVPVVVVVLARMGLVPVEKLREHRGYFIVIAFVIAAIITPPDIVSMLALAISMCVLYEVGVFAATHFIRYSKPPEEKS